MAARTLVNAEFRLRSPDGGWRWTNVRAAPVLDDAGSIEKWAGINIDTRKRAEAALRESEERRDLALEATQIGTFVWHVREDRGEPDIRMLALFDQPPDGGLSLQTALATMIHPDDGPRYATAIAEASRLDGSRKLQMDIRVRRGDGSWRWLEIRARVSFGEDGHPLRMAGTALDITVRKTAEAALQESEDRQAFLLKLSDALRPLRSSTVVAKAGLDLLRRHLSLERTYVAQISGADHPVLILAEDSSPDLAPMPAQLLPSDFPEGFQRAALGLMVVNDINQEVDLTELDRQSLASIGLTGFIVALLHRGADGMIWALVAGVTAPRRWSRGEGALLAEAAERIWGAMERARTEAALRNSEARFQQFAQASAAGLWIRNAATLDMEYTSPAVATIYGVRPEALLGVLEVWAATVVPEDREAALAHIERVRIGETDVHEFRIQRPADQAFRWVRNTGFPLRDPAGEVERVGGIFEDVTEAKLATEHQSVLLAELQHRVRNIMAMIRSVALRTAGGASNVDDYRSSLEGRLMALARVQVLLTREANAGGSLRHILVSEVSAQAHHDDQFELDGPEIRLSPKAVEVLTLAFHELATNALKYGAFSVPEGRLKVSWAPFEKHGRTWLSLDWLESGAPARDSSERRGFGTDLIEGRIPYELRGTASIAVKAEGARCHLEFPLKDGESILETDAPALTTIFGGTLDMTDAPDLTNRKVLVVEDDYFIASDTAAALRGAGAEILGPCPNQETTLDLLQSQTPTHAVLDLNLGGGGPKFEIARLLQERGVPFIFMTGYDPELIPADFEDVVRLQKPVAFREIVEAVSQL